MNANEADLERAHAVLELRHVCRRFGTDPAVDALVDVNLRVEAGEWLAITGPSGAGKSTLLNVIGCLDHATSGRYRFDGLDISSLTDRQRAGLRSRQIGFVFQSCHLMPYRSVLENVMLSDVYSKQPLAGRRQRALQAIEDVGLTHRANFLPSKLSGGEMQRAAIARALMGTPDLLLCDEPTGNLDSMSTGEILQLFKELNQKGMTLVVVTHDEDVAHMAHRRVHIIDGHLTYVPNDESSKASSTDESSKDPRRVAKSGMLMRDLLNEAVAGMFSRPGRMTLTVLGVIIGITAIVATLGLTRTAGNRIVSQFDKLAATELFVNPRPGPSGIVNPRAIPWDAPSRLARLNGVVFAGTKSEVNVEDALVSSSPVRDPRSRPAFKLTVQAASPSLFDAVRAEMKTGRAHDLGHSERADRVAVLGPDAAERLGIVGVEQLPAISIGDRLYLVIGILRDVVREPDLLSSVIIPEGTARQDFSLAGPGRVVVETDIGATYLIARQARSALNPGSPRELKIEVPPEPRRVREDVQSDLNILFLLLGGLSLVVGAIGIANITLVSVMERIGEIGLRRAIGATRGHIVAQFLFESATLGIIGGILGATVGVLIVVGFSAYQAWTPVLDPLIPLAAPPIGAVIGLISGVYPAVRAAKLEPVEAFRA